VALDQINNALVQTLSKPTYSHKVPVSIVQAAHLDVKVEIRVVLLDDPKAGYPCNQRSWKGFERV